ncbi:MAG: cytochrome c [Burkholderiales bacterium]
MKRKLVAAAVALALGAGVAATALAQVKPEVLVKQRQSAMTLIGKYFGPLGGMLKGAVPFDAAVVARNAGYLEVLAKMPWDGFAEGTKGEKSHALPAVWSDAAKFKQAQDHLQTAVASLVTVSKGGDEAKTKAAIGDVGKACGGCHDNFREKR